MNKSPDFFLSAEERLNRALEEVRAVVMEQRENAVMAERRKVEELEESLAQLRQVIMSQCYFQIFHQQNKTKSL